MKIYRNKYLRNWIEGRGCLPDVLTVGQFAELLGVAPRTVSKWVDAGRIPGAYRIPECLDRRIPLASALVFCRDSGLPDIVAQARPVLHYVGPVPHGLAMLGPVAPHGDGFSLCLELQRLVVIAQDDDGDSELKAYAEAGATLVLMPPAVIPALAKLAWGVELPKEEAA
jgi:excisionase family DNA binding protein